MLNYWLIRNDTKKSHNCHPDSLWLFHRLRNQKYTQALTYTWHFDRHMQKGPWTHPHTSSLCWMPAITWPALWWIAVCLNKGKHSIIRWWTSVAGENMLSFCLKKVTKCGKDVLVAVIIWLMCYQGLSDRLWLASQHVQLRHSTVFVHHFQLRVQNHFLSLNHHSPKGPG